MRFMIAVLLLSCACNKAQENAKLLDKGAVCVGRTGDLLFCVIKGQPFVCDNDQCLPAGCPAALPPLSTTPEAEDD